MLWKLHTRKIVAANSSGGQRVARWLLPQR